MINESKILFKKIKANIIDFSIKISVQQEIK